MQRRDFLTRASAGIGAATIAGPVLASQNPAQLSEDALRHVTQHIHAQFGSSFEICTTRRVGSQTECMIEHFGNRLIVTSNDNAHWTIQRASEM